MQVGFWLIAMVSYCGNGLRRVVGPAYFDLARDKVKKTKQQQNSFWFDTIWVRRTFSSTFVGLTQENGGLQEKFYMAFKPHPVRGILLNDAVCIQWLSWKKEVDIHAGL